jgi:translation initiation factor 1
MAHRLVFSTESRPGAARQPAPCARCGSHPCRCEPRRSLPAPEQDVRVRREKAGRGGKLVTVAAPLALTRQDARALLAELKRRYGSGGSLRAAQTRTGEPCFELEIQGDHADRMVTDLAAAGYRVKRSGG